MSDYEHLIIIAVSGLPFYLRWHCEEAIIWNNVFGGDKLHCPGFLLPL